ncbi:hypothetical protein [Flavobacterium difficile]|uniref:Uncharacterized protein n=1 Tax=Flavobacterium difficile TaxID=2709659 RepID=A0ABX0I0S4_9FLAO|nr:hypothetical protein [Flavobacterium difficile]NHM00798.1 hypothetical protein [Flavobacterium difficile]
MSKILHILAAVNESVNVFELKPKRKYTEPKIYTGGIEVSKWSKYSNDEKEKALKKTMVCLFFFS